MSMSIACCRLHEQSQYNVNHAIMHSQSMQCQWRRQRSSARLRFNFFSDLNTKLPFFLAIAWEMEIKYGLMENKMIERNVNMSPHLSFWIFFHEVSSSSHMSSSPCVRVCKHARIESAGRICVPMRTRGFALGT